MEIPCEYAKNAKLMLLVDSGADVIIIYYSMFEKDHLVLLNISCRKINNLYINLAEVDLSSPQVSSALSLAVSANKTSVEDIFFKRTVSW